MTVLSGVWGLLGALGSLGVDYTNVEVPIGLHEAIVDVFTFVLSRIASGVTGTNRGNHKAVALYPK
jgi:hypothetical protein